MTHAILPNVTVTLAIRSWLLKPVHRQSPSEAITMQNWSNSHPDSLWVKANSQTEHSPSQLIIILITCCSLTRVKLTALCKHLMTKTTLTYISNKQNLKYCSLPLSVTQIKMSFGEHKLQYNLFFFSRHPETLTNNTFYFIIQIQSILLHHPRHWLTEKDNIMYCHFLLWPLPMLARHKVANPPH